MCGIGGVLRTDGGPIPDSWLDRLDDRLAHRGPDGNGRFRDAVDAPRPDGPRRITVALTHHRLSIIDHAGGAQPMVSRLAPDPNDPDEPSTIAVVFNGCIYNHRDLRAELEAAGHFFESDHADTEVLVHGHRAWGPELAQKLEAMYAYAIWDASNGTVTLGRDWFGEKPLYIAQHQTDDGEIIVFASNARAVADVAALAGEGDFDPPKIEWVRGYLQLGYGWRGETIYHCERLTPSSVLSVPIELPAHLPAFSTTKPPRHVEDVVEQLLDQAVQRRLEADVPLGCFLSGGVDSTLIAALAKRHVPDLRTFSVRMPDPRYDESAFAEAAATHLGADHTTLDIAADPAADLVHLIETLGQPFGDSSILPTYWVCRAARTHVKVALSGDGGDELFYGYERYQRATVVKAFRRLLGWLPDGFGASAHPKSRTHRLGRAAAMARDFPRSGVLALESIFHHDWVAALTDANEAWSAPGVATRGPVGQALRAADLRSYLPFDLLTKVDTASMAVALEVRAPFLDRDLCETVLTWPAEAFARGGRKGLLRAVARRHAPAEVIDRPKMGFAIPIDDWFRDDTGGMRTLLLDRLRGSDPFGPIPINQDAVETLLTEHLDDGIQHGQRLFALLTLSIWAGRDR